VASVIKVAGREDKLELAKSLEGERRGVDLLLPTDVVVADKFAADANAQTVSIDNISPMMDGSGYWSESVKTFRMLADCKTVIWNGPMGVFDQFAQGTEAIRTLRNAME